MNNPCGEGGEGVGVGKNNFLYYQCIVRVKISGGYKNMVKIQAFCSRNQNTLSSDFGLDIYFCRGRSRNEYEAIL